MSSVVVWDWRKEGMTRRRGGIGEDDIEERSRYLPADYSTIECGRRLGCLEGA